LERNPGPIHYDEIQRLIQMFEISKVSRRTDGFLTFNARCFIRNLEHVQYVLCADLRKPDSAPNTPGKGHFDILMEALMNLS